MKTIRMGSTALLLGAAMLTACATTHVTSSWKDPSASTAKVSKVLVVAMVPNEAVRRNLEQRLSADFRAREQRQSPACSSPRPPPT